MTTPWTFARMAAAALAADGAAQSFAFTRYGSPLSVFLASEGTAPELPRGPRVLVEADDASDGPHDPSRIALLLGLRVPASVDPATGETRDSSKPVAADGGFFETGDGEGLCALLRLCADAVADRLWGVGACLESRSFTYDVGAPTGDIGACALAFRLAYGLFDGEADPPAAFIDSPPETTQPQP